MNRLRKVLCQSTRNGIIICGFPGIGKTTMAKSFAHVVDLDSAPYKRQWPIYTDVALPIARDGYTVLLSSHLQLRSYLHQRGIQYILALPAADMQVEYIQRYIKRGNSDAFIQLLQTNWQRFCVTLPHEQKVLHIETYISDYLAQINQS